MEQMAGTDSSDSVHGPQTVPSHSDSLSPPSRPAPATKGHESDLFTATAGHRSINYPLLQWYQLGQADCPLQVSDEDLARVEKAYRYLDREVLGRGDIVVYGLHTGYGENERTRVDPKDWRHTQANLLEYLQVGVGEPLPEPVVRRALKLQAIKVAYGVSAIHPETYRALLALANDDTLPPVPRKGSLGASGDLIPMAHAVAPLFAEGPRGPRDVIGLVNTNSIMAAWAIELDHRTRQLLEFGFQVVALVSIAVGASAEHFSEGLKHRSVHDSYARAGEVLLALRNKYLSATLVTEGKKSLHQARYSIRCAPQILGYCLDTLDICRDKIRSEALAIADNPLMLSSGPWHGGLFYAIGLSSAAESMQEIAHRLAEMLDRQVLILMDHRLNGGLPDNLSVASDSHCKGIHQLLSALLQEIKARSVPVRQMSFSCEGNNQDLVPCSMTALNNLNDQLNTLEEIIRGAMFCALRAAVMRSPQAPPAALKLNAWKAFKPRDTEAILWP